MHFQPVSFSFTNQLWGTWNGKKEAFDVLLCVSTVFILKTQENGLWLQLL